MRSFFGTIALALLLVVGAPGPAPLHAQVAAPIVASDTLREVRLHDGSTLFGRVVAVTGDRITLVTEAGVRVELERSQIASIGAARGQVRDGEMWPADPNRTRLFFGPTGRMLRQGEGYVGLYELFFPFLSYGVTDWVTVAGGTPVVPGAIGEVFYLAPKVRLFSSGSAEVSAGVLAFFASELDDVGSVGVAYAAGTFGTFDDALTVGAGFPFIADDENSEFADRPIILVGGEKRTGRRTKLVSENYLVVGESSALVSGGLRLFGDRFSADAGVAAMVGEENFCCLPLLNVVYNFGGPR